jgi:hypothetical protein
VQVRDGLVVHDDDPMAGELHLTDAVVTP